MRRDQLSHIKPNPEHPNIAIRWDVGNDIELLPFTRTLVGRDSSFQHWLSNCYVRVQPFIYVHDVDCFGLVASIERNSRHGEVSITPQRHCRESDMLPKQRITILPDSEVSLYILRHVVLIAWIDCYYSPTTNNETFIPLIFLSYS